MIDKTAENSLNDMIEPSMRVGTSFNDMIEPQREILMIW